jgi:gamma-glutamyltranspeptidase/glutathione hydrolase
MTPDTSIRAPHGLVASPDSLASQAGVATLRAGGTAVDAAIATSAVLAVTSPHMCGMGGDLFALVHEGPGAPACLNSSGRAGSGADPDRVRAEGHTTIPLTGHIAAVPVPGCVDGWLTLHERYGRLPLADVMKHAIDFADDGFPASPLLAADAAGVADVPGAAALRPATDGAGTLVRRPGVARSLRAVVNHGRDGFYGGEFGEGLLTLGGGEFAPEDLAVPLADWVEPLSVRAFGHDVWTTPPNSQGYLTLLGLAIIEGLDLPDDPADGAWAHLMVEAARAAGRDRPEVLHEHADVSVLLAEAEVTRRRAGIDPDRRSRLAGPAADGGTIHLSTADADGMGVSLIQSNAAGFGSHHAVGETDILLHCRGVGFSLEPGHPAEYGPGRRPPHTLSPAIVTRPDGELAIVAGTMGGDAQPQILLQTLTRMLRHGQPPGPAIAAPRWALGLDGGNGFDTWNAVGDQIVMLEVGSHGWVTGLESRGHGVRPMQQSPGFGHADAIVATPAGWAGAADPRAVVGAAIGY